MKHLSFVHLFLSLFFYCPASMQAQWVQTGDLYGGDVYALTTNGTTLFAGTYNRGGGIFRSPHLFPPQVGKHRALDDGEEGVRRRALRHPPAEMLVSLARPP